MRKVILDSNKRKYNKVTFSNHTLNNKAKFYTIVKDKKVFYNEIVYILQKNATILNKLFFFGMPYIKENFRSIIKKLLIYLFIKNIILILNY